MRTIAILFVLLAGCGPSAVSTANFHAAETWCEAPIAVSVVQTQPGCEIDERVSGQASAIRYGCGGGAAEASFGDSVFHGNVGQDGTVDLSIRTTFPFSDGCTWETKQEIRGAMSSGMLSYSYTERPIDGQSGCSNGCVAQATVQVQAQ